MIAQSIAWLCVPGDTPAVETDPLDPSAPGYAGVAALEESVARMKRGVVLRDGLFYGPGTWYAPDGLMAERARAGTLRPASSWTSFVHIDDAAAAAVAALEWPAGIVNIVDDEPATTAEWLPHFQCEGAWAGMATERGFVEERVRANGVSDGERRPPSSYRYGISAVLFSSQE
jgi:nucleoside-diphosphate-sugar epimerase